MSAVDPKPTYSNSVVANLFAFAIAGDKEERMHDLSEMLTLKYSMMDRFDLEWRYAKKNYQGMDIRDELFDMMDQSESLASLYNYYDGRENLKKHREEANLVIDALLFFASDCDAIYRDSNAAYKLFCDVVMQSPTIDDREVGKMNKASFLSQSVFEAGNACLKQDIFAMRATAHHFNHAIITQLGLEFSRRSLAHKIVFHTAKRKSRNVFSALWTVGHSKFRAKIIPNTPNHVELMQMLMQEVQTGLTYDPEIKCLYLGRIRAYKFQKTLYLMTVDQAHKIYDMANRCFNASLCSALETAVMDHQCTIPLIAVRRFYTTCAAAISEHITQGKHAGEVIKAIHTLWFAEFHRAYEPTEPKEYVSNWKEKYDVLTREAYDVSPSIRIIHGIGMSLPQALRLEFFRLHHIFVSLDTDPALLAEKAFSSNEKARKPEPTLYNAFLKFVKTYELCMFLYKNREWPAVDGDMTAKVRQAYLRCLRGNFSMPPDEAFGELWISSHFPYVRYADQMALRAKDATRIPWNRDAATNSEMQYSAYDYNELLHAIRRGNTLGAPHEWDIDTCRKKFFSGFDGEHPVCDCAAKAENYKSDIKPRVTYSACGEFRWMQAEFDRNCQVMNDILGCGSIRADVAAHARGMTKMARGTNSYSLTTSHDISDWSGSQDRDEWLKFYKYRAGMFRGTDPEGMARAWKCFDCIVNKNGYINWAHVTNGGFQGFPGTLDTSLHVLILVFFLHRMKASGRIPRDCVTLAKATIDDCVAQIERINCTYGEFEIELNRHYISMGYELDNIKSVLSYVKSIYLNKAYIKGALISQAFKVFCKVDRAIEDVMKSPLDDAAAVISGCKSAAENGMDIFSAYYAAIFLSTYYLLTAAPNIAQFHADTYAVLWFLPRGDGGLGLPSMAEMACKEHPDSRAHANYVLQNWAYARRYYKETMAPPAVRLWAGAKTSPWRIVNKAAIFFNPRSATRHHVVDLESMRRSAVIEGARGYALAEPYKGILNMAKDPEIQHAYACLLLCESPGVDMQFLEAYSSHLPERIIDAMVGKVTSFRVAKELMSINKILYIQYQMANSFRQIIDTALEMRFADNDNQSKAFDRMADINGYVQTCDEREEFYAYNNVMIANHTAPSPFDVVVVSNPAPDPGVEHYVGFDFETTHKFADDMGICTRSILSGFGQMYPWKSKSWVADSHDKYSFLDQVSSTFVEGCGIIYWAQCQNMDVKAWEMVYMKRWLGDHNQNAVDYVHHSFQGHIKRANAAFGDRYHPIFVGSNFARSSTVSEKNISLLLEDDTYMIDPLSILGACYTISTVVASFLINMCGKYQHSLPNFKWEIAAHPDTLESYKQCTNKVKISMRSMEAVCELYLDGKTFLEVDGGTGKQLRDLMDPNRLNALFESLARPDHEDVTAEELTGEIPLDLAPTFGTSTELRAPLGFIVTQTGSIPVKALVTDRVVGNEKVRLTELSPSSIKLAGVYALQKFVESCGEFDTMRMFLGDTEIIAKHITHDKVKQVVSDTFDTILDNFGTQQIGNKTGTALRANGIFKCRVDNTVLNEKVDVVELLTRQALEDVDNFVKAMRMSVRDRLSVYGSDYKAAPRKLQMSKDPEKANVAARVKEFRKKMKSRSQAYTARIVALKRGYTTLNRDRKTIGEDASSKVAFLAGSSNAFSAVAITDDLLIDWEETSIHLGNIMEQKIEKLEMTRKYAFDLTIADLEEPDLDQLRLDIEEFNEVTEKVSDWWHPSHYAAGCINAFNGILSDLETERTEVYYVPKTIRITTRVRTRVVRAINQEERIKTGMDRWERHIKGVPSPPPEEHHEEVAKPEPQLESSKGKEVEAEPKPEEKVSIDKEAREKMSIAEMFRAGIPAREVAQKMREEARKALDAKLAIDIRPFYNSLTLGQVIAVFNNNGYEWNSRIEGLKDLSMETLRNCIYFGQFISDELDNPEIRDELFPHFHWLYRRAPFDLIAPDVSEVKVDDRYVDDVY